jgi:hypothetical protein
LNQQKYKNPVNTKEKGIYLRLPLVHAKGLVGYRRMIPNKVIGHIIHAHPYEDPYL